MSETIKFSSFINKAFMFTVSLALFSVQIIPKVKFKKKKMDEMHGEGYEVVGKIVMEF